MLEWLFSLIGPNALKTTDPVFGVMRGRAIALNGVKCVCWQALRGFTWQAKEAMVRVYSDDGGPTQRQRDLFSELQQRFSEMRTLVQGPLAKEYMTLHADWSFSGPVLNNSKEIWNAVHLASIEVHGTESQPDFVLCHAGGLDGEHELNVSIRNWQVSEVMLEG